MTDYMHWRHAFKLDPNKKISEEALTALCESGTDAVIIGGTDGVTFDNVLNLLSRIRRFSVPCILEVSDQEAVTPGFDNYFIPTVLNSQDLQWVIGKHHEAAKSFAEVMDWETLLGEGYCVLNGAAKVAEQTKAQTDLTVDDVLGYALLAENIFRLPVFYMEYSGTYGDPLLVGKVSRTLHHTQLFYGGGITSKEQAREMAQFADTIVVGNIIYDDLRQALRTVQAVKPSVS